MCRQKKTISCSIVLDVVFSHFKSSWTEFNRYTASIDSYHPTAANIQISTSNDSKLEANRHCHQFPDEMTPLVNVLGMKVCHRVLCNLKAPARKYRTQICTAFPPSAPPNVKPTSRTIPSWRCQSRQRILFRCRLCHILLRPETLRHTFTHTHHQSPRYQSSISCLACRTGMCIYMKAQFRCTSTTERSPRVNLYASPFPGFKGSVLMNELRKGTIYACYMYYVGYVWQCLSCYPHQ